MSAHCKYAGSETTSFYSPELFFFFGSRSGKYAFRFESRTLNTWFYLIGMVCCRPRTVCIYAIGTYRSSTVCSLLASESNSRRGVHHTSPFPVSTYHGIPMG